MDAIPYKTAIKLCEQIYNVNRHKWYTVNGLWCWGCTTFSRGNIRKRCFNNKNNNTGCGQVNRAYKLKKEGKI